MNEIHKDLKCFIFDIISEHKLVFSFMCSICLFYAFDFSIRPYILKTIINKISNNPYSENYFSLILWPIIIYAIILIALCIICAIEGFLNLKIFPIIRASIITKMVDYTHSHSCEFFQNNFAGNIGNKISNDIVNGIEKIIESFFGAILLNFLTLLGGIITLTFSHVYFGATFFLWSIFYLFFYIKLNKKSKYLSRELAESKSQLSGVMVDSFSNSCNVKLFTNKKYELSFIDKYVKDVYQKDMDFRKAIFYQQFFSIFSNIILSFIMLILLVYTKQRNLITAGDFALVLIVSFSILGILRNLSKEYVNFSRDNSICNQALSVVTEKHKINDSDKSKTLTVTKGKIVFDSVFFSYPSSCNNYLFRNLCVTINGGQKVGIVGYSGSSKSTFVNLIARLFDIQNGKISIDDQDISVVTQSSLRKNMSLISQDPIMFHRTLMENIRYGDIYASDEEIVEASKKAYAHEFIMNIPGCYESMAGERGVKLSCGQRQKISIARAMLKNAPILILDEATSSLDSISEALIQDSLRVLMKNKTVIVIAHRLSTLLDMDRILVFDKGIIVEDGSHEELLSKRGVYWLLWIAQNNQGSVTNQS